MDVPRWHGLPWESGADVGPVPLACRPSGNITPGELVLRTLLAEFASQAASKIESLNSQPLVRTLMLLGDIVVKFDTFRK